LVKLIYNIFPVTKEDPYIFTNSFRISVNYFHKVIIKNFLLKYKSY